MTASKPLSTLLANALGRFESVYATNGVPPLVVWSNLLRVLSDGGVPTRALPARAVMSKRVVRVATRNLERHGVVNTVDRSVHLTDAGQAAYSSGHKRVAVASQGWSPQLRKALEAIVSQIDIELPHFPTGYGQGDSSFTGGNFIPAAPGPPAIPAHGQEWPVVMRDVSAVTSLPISALLSQALIAFTINYDLDAEGVFGGLGNAVRFFQHVPDTGMPLAAARKTGDVRGTGRSNFERHRLVDVEDGVALLTARGKRVRDRYPAHTFVIEANWAGRYGASLVQTLRSELEALSIDDQPDFPDTNSWLRRSGW